MYRKYIFILIGMMLLIGIGIMLYVNTQRMNKLERMTDSVDNLVEVEVEDVVDVSTVQIEDVTPVITTIKKEDMNAYIESLGPERIILKDYLRREFEKNEE